MINLRETQQALQDYLQEKDSPIETLIVGKNPAEVKRRLGIYREAYQLRLKDNLLKQYPVLAAHVGSEFQVLAKAYHDQFPPKDVLIRHYGAHFSAFLKNKSADFLSELATFEWAMNLALDDSAEATLLTIEDLQKFGQDVLFEQRFSFHPSLQSFSFRYDVPTFWVSARKKQSIVKPTLLKDPIYVFVWRKAFVPYHTILKSLEYDLFLAARKGASFVDLCDIAAKSMPENQAANLVAQTVSRWLNEGWLVK